MPDDGDPSKEALEKVEKLTESEPVNGEDLLGSEDLKRKLAEAKKRLGSPPSDSDSGER